MTNNQQLIMNLKVLIVLMITCIVMCLGRDSYESPTTYYNRKSSRRSGIYGGGKTTARDRGTRYMGSYPGESGGYGGVRGGYGGSGSGSSYGVGKTFATGYGGFDTPSLNGVGVSSYNPGYIGGGGVGRGRGKTSGRGRGGNKGASGGVGTAGRKYPPVIQRKTPTSGKGISTTVQRKMGYRQRNY